MNREILERLAMDRASGELSPDVEALFEHCLVQDPALKMMASESEQALHLAKQAMTLKAAPRLPEPNFQKQMLSFPRESSGLRSARLWALGMAACFMGGLLSGGFFLRDKPTTAAPQVAMHTTVIPKNTPVQSGFWSVDRLVSKAGTSRPASNPSIIWKSPVRTPELRTQ